jgi:hypothetical protein
MRDELVDLVAGRIDSELSRINVMGDPELLAAIQPWLDARTGEGLYSANLNDRFLEWMHSTLLPQLRRLGETGQRTWDAICDPSSAITKERIASIVLVVAVLSGLQNLDISTLVAIVVMAIRSKTRRP